ncbi:RepB family plasmid replication initiator protein [Streptohalobacillus salinus]
MFDLENKKTYKRTAQFKRGVLDLAISEINKHTELNVHYTKKEKIGK